MGATAELVVVASAPLPGERHEDEANDKRRRPEIPANVFMRRFCFIS
jgi:hypothetical protein